MNPVDTTSWLTRHTDAIDEWFYWATPAGEERLALGVERRCERLAEVGNAPAFLALAFDRSGEGWDGVPNFELVVPERVVERARPTAVKPLPAGEIGIEPNSYAERVAAALRAIDAGLVRKVVVARQHVIERRLDVEATIETLRDAYPTCFIFARRNSDGVTFLGATPERLVRLRGARLDTAAVAGTAPRGADRSKDLELAEALLNSEKDRREHASVSEMIRDALGPICADLEIPTSPEIMTLPGLHHLHTPIRGTVQDGVEPFDVIARLHPTPAVCGAPRDAAMALIRELEPFSRGLYAGVVGWVQNDELETAVAIRSLLARGERTLAFAGAGIVQGSDPNLEDEETQTKLRSVLRVARWV